MHRKQIRRWHKLLAASASLIAILTAALVAPATAAQGPSVNLWAASLFGKGPDISFILMSDVVLTSIDETDFTTFGTAKGCFIQPNLSETTYQEITVSGCSDGTVALQMFANSVADSSGNFGPAEGVVTSFATIDRVAPNFSFNSLPTTTTETSFSITASGTEVSFLDLPEFAPTVSGDGCRIESTWMLGPDIVMNIADCKVGAEVSVTILPNSYLDKSQNFGPAQTLVSPMLKVVAQASQPVATLPVSALPPADPPLAQQPVAEASVAQAPIAEAPVLQQQVEIVSEEVPEPVLSPETEPVVPMAPIASVRAIESGSVVMSSAPRQPRASVVVAVAERLEQPVAQAQPLAQPQPDLAPQPAATTVATAVNLSWVMPAASVLSAVCGAVAGAMLVRKRQTRSPRLRIA